MSSNISWIFDIWVLYISLYSSILPCRTESNMWSKLNAHDGNVYLRISIPHAKLSKPSPHMARGYTSPSPFPRVWQRNIFGRLDLSRMICWSGSTDLDKSQVGRSPYLTSQWWCVLSLWYIDGKTMAEIRTVFGSDADGHMTLAWDILEVIWKEV